MQYNYNDDFVRIITSTYGSVGTKWLAQLSTIVQQCARKWQLTQIIPYENLTYNFVCAAIMDNLPVVLKIQCNAHEFNKELTALRTFNGYGCVQIIHHDPTLKALILERAVPGASLVSFVRHQDTHAIEITCKVIQKLHQAPAQAHAFDRLEQLIPTFEAPLALPTEFLAKAVVLRNHLLTTTTNHVLLHGDMHYDNILAHNSDWLAIDPNGIIGDPLYDTSVCIRNPLTTLLQLPNLKDMIHQRIFSFAHYMQCNPQRIYDWAYLQTMTSICWSIEDGLDIRNHLQFLTLLHKMPLF